MWFVLFMFLAWSEAKWCGVSDCGEETACLTRPCVGLLGHACGESNVPMGTPCLLDVESFEACREEPSCNGLGACVQALSAGGAPCSDESCVVGQCNGVSSMCVCDTMVAPTAMAVPAVSTTTSAAESASHLFTGNTTSGAESGSVWHIALPIVLCSCLVATCALVWWTIVRKKRGRAAAASATSDEPRAVAIAIYGAAPVFDATPVYTAAPPLLYYDDEDDDDCGGTKARSHMYTSAPAIDSEEPYRPVF